MSKKPKLPAVPTGEIVLYQTPDGQTRVECRFDERTIWLTQRLIAELYQVSISTVNEHIKGIYADQELSPEATIRKYRIVQTEGVRQVERQVDHYSLDMILAVGYRVRSERGVLFRQWATARLQEYLVNGFVMDDERLKNPGGWDYFDELLARIREIRASEKRFYQKVRDLFALSSDYRPDDRDAQLFFAETQNKLLFAVTGKTAAEIVVSRADPDASNMALTSWSGSRVRKHDVVVAKNYLSADEVDTLNRLVVVFLEQAELRVKERQQLTLDYWRTNVDRLLEYSEKAILDHAGTVSREEMERVAQQRFETFDEHRRLAEAKQADAEDLAELERAGKQIEEAKTPAPRRKKGGKP